MTDTLVIQSHRNPLPFNWPNECVSSVQRWAGNNGFAYQWLGDVIFDALDPALIEKTSTQKVIAGDLGDSRRFNGL